MSSLTDLNNYADGTITYSDVRASNVLFNFPTAVDLTDITITSQTFTLQRTIDIVEIVQPSVAAVQFQVDVSNLAGTTVSFGTLPSGVTVDSGANGVYTVSGIDSVSDWEAVREPTISLPTADTQGSFNYTCKIIYTNDGVRKEKTWTVGNTKFVAQIQMTSSVSLTEEPLLKGASANLISVITVQDVTVELAIRAVFTLNILETVIHQFDASVSLSSSISATPLFYNFSGSTVIKENPNPEEYGEFGQHIHVDAGNRIITNIDQNSSRIAAIYDSAGNLSQYLSRQDTSNVSEIKIAGSQSGNYIAIVERDVNPTNSTNAADQTQGLHLYKRNSSTGQYSHIDEYTLPGRVNNFETATFNMTEVCIMTDTYLALYDSTYVLPNQSYPSNGFDGRVMIFSFTDSGGWVKEREHTGTRSTLDGNTNIFTQQLGNVLCLNDSYYVLGEAYQTSFTGYNRLFVYNTSNGNLVRTIANDDSIRRLAFDPDDEDIIVATSGQNVLKWDVTTGNTVTSNITSSSVSNINGNFDRWQRLSSNLIGVTQDGARDKIAIIRENDGKTEDNIAYLSGNGHIDQFRFIGGNKLIHGDIFYDDDETNQGRLYIRTQE